MLSFVAAEPALSDWVVQLTERISGKNINEAKRYLNDCFHYLEQKRSRFIIDTSLKQKLKEAQTKGDKKEIDALLLQFQELQKSLTISRPARDGEPSRTISKR